MATMRRTASGCLTAQAKANGPPKSCATRSSGRSIAAAFKNCSTNCAKPSSERSKLAGTSEWPKPGRRDATIMRREALGDALPHDAAVRIAVQQENRRSGAPFGHVDIGATDADC